MNHRYLIIRDDDVFNTPWFEPENHYCEGDIVIDLATGRLYIGSWEDIEEDHL